MVKEYIVLAIILAGLFSGCVGEESITGKYVLEENHKSYFMLYEDGTFNLWYLDGGSSSGTYRYENGNLTLTFIPFGNVELLTKNGTAFIDDKGTKYAKE